MEKYIIIFIFQAIALNHLSQAGLYNPVLFGAIEIEIRQKLINGQIQLKACSNWSNMTIQANLAALQFDIDSRVKDSQDKARLGLELCVSAHTNSLSQLDSDNLKRCNPNQSVELGAVIWKLSLIQAQIRMCRSATYSLKCYDYFKKQIDQKIENGKEVCNNALEAASECLVTKYGEALEIIWKADGRFSNCNGVGGIVAQ